MTRQRWWECRKGACAFAADTHFKSKVRFFRENECKVGLGVGDSGETSLWTTRGKVRLHSLQVPSAIYWKNKCKVVASAGDGGETSLSSTRGTVGVTSGKVPDKFQPTQSAIS
ncbi:hypothetical protein B0H12DRAFT_1138719 [Mycena haematopus]|nr:hypothetical protein B0H12DRAFT_1138719 [Mycena haematopus]